MATKITYDGNEIANFNSGGKVLKCAGNTMNTDVIVETDEAKGGNYNIVQTNDGDNCSLAITDANTFVLTTKTITANGTYAASADNADGYSSVSVNVSGGGTWNFHLTNYRGTEPVRYFDESGSIQIAFMDLGDSDLQVYAPIVFMATGYEYMDNFVNIDYRDTDYTHYGFPLVLTAKNASVLIA